MITVFTILTSLSAIFILAIFFHPKFRELKSKYQDGWNFVATMLATLIGVFLAISISERKELKDEHENFHDLIQVALNDLQITKTYNAGMIGFLGNVDSLTVDLIEINSLALPENCFEILKRENVTKFIDRKIYSILYEEIAHIRQMKNYFEKVDYQAGIRAAKAYNLRVEILIYVLEYMDQNEIHKKTKNVDDLEKEIKVFEDRLAEFWKN